MANVVPMLAGVGLLSVCCISSSVAASMMGGETEETAESTESTETTETAEATGSTESM